MTSVWLSSVKGAAGSGGESIRRVFKAHPVLEAARPGHEDLHIVELGGRKEPWVCPLVTSRTSKMSAGGPGKRGGALPRRRQRARRRRRPA